MDTAYVSLCHGNETANIPTAPDDFSDGKAAPTIEPIVADFDWDNEIQGQLLSAYPIGYIFGNIMGGPLCNYLGAKRYMGVSMILAGILQLASPLAACQGPWFLYALRLVFGARVSNTRLLKHNPSEANHFQGGMFCVSNALMAKWIPVQERSRA